MNIDITKLNSGIVNKIPVDFTYEFTDEQLAGTDIMAIKNFNVKGYVQKNILDDVSLSLTITGIMVLSCAVTLKPVDYKFEAEINGPYDELLQEIGENCKKSLNILEIFPIIWENILLETPLRVVSDEAKDIQLSGDGWVLDREENTSNNPFKELLDEKESR